MGIEHDLFTDGLVRVGDHPRLRTRLYRLAGEGRLQVVLPGVLALPGVLDPALFLRALCLWCPRGCSMGAPPSRSGSMSRQV